MDLWSLRAPFYKWMRRFWPLSVVLDAEQRAIKSLLGSLENRARRILDIGSGTGRALHCLAPAPVMIGLDKNKKMARSIPPPAIVADAHHLPIKPGSIDISLAIGLSEYLADMMPLFRELAMAGRPASHVVMTSSPPSMFTALRRLAGSHIWTRRPAEIIAAASQSTFVLIDSRHSFSQDAFLFKRG